MWVLTLPNPRTNCLLNYFVISKKYFLRVYSHNSSKFYIYKLLFPILHTEHNVCKLSYKVSPPLAHAVI